MTPSITPLRLSFRNLGCSFSTLTALLASVFFATQASGAVIVWDASAVNTDTSNASQISTAGSLFLAVDMYSSITSTNYTVNGVTFTGSNANITIGKSGGPSQFGTAPGTGTYTYASILDGGDYIAPLSDSPTHPIQISNLLSGHSYQLQIWTPYWNTNWVTRYSDVAPTSGSGYTFAAGQSPSVNTGFTTGSVTSQYILGTFTADLSGTQNLYYFGDNSAAMFGAIQVRDLGLVPEPTTIALCALGGLALMVRSRFRQRKLAA